MIKLLNINIKVLIPFSAIWRCRRRIQMMLWYEPLGSTKIFKVKSTMKFAQNYNKVTIYWTNFSKEKNVLQMNFDVNLLVNYVLESIFYHCFCLMKMCTFHIHYLLFGHLNVQTQFAMLRIHIHTVQFSYTLTFWTYTKCLFFSFQGHFFFYKLWNDVFAVHWPKWKPYCPK